MATLTKAQLADRVLEALGVNGAGQSASSEDSNRVQEAIDSTHDRLRKDGLAPFATTAVPEWAQTPLTHIVAVEMAATFGVGGERLAVLAGAAAAGRHELAAQMQAKQHPRPVRARYF